MREPQADIGSSRAENAPEKTGSKSFSAPTDARCVSVRATSIIAIAAAIAAGVGAFPIGEAVKELYKPSEEAASAAYAFTRLNAEMSRALAKNGALAFGALGGLLGVALGFAGGVSRKSILGALSGMCVGAALGVLAGALPSFPLMPHHWMNRSDERMMSNLMGPLFTHLGLWAAIGAAGGLAFAVGRFGIGPKPINRRRLIVGSIVGGIAGVVLGGAAVAAPSLQPYRSDVAELIKVPIGMPLVMPVAAVLGIIAGACIAARPFEYLKSILGGLIGAALGIILYEVAGAIVFPLADTANPFSLTAETRLLARLCVTLFATAGILVFTLCSWKSRPKPAAVPAHTPSLT